MLITNERMNRAGKPAETAFEPYRVAASWAVGLQEPYARLARAQIEQFRKQQEIFAVLVGESFRLYAGLLRATVPSPRNGFPVAERLPEPPIEDYDRLSVDEVIDRLGELDASKVEELIAYEKSNQNRAALLERLERSLV